MAMQEKDIELLNRWLAGEKELERVIWVEKGLYEELIKRFEQLRFHYQKGPSKLIEALKKQKVLATEIAHEIFVYLHKQGQKLHFENWPKFFSYAEKTALTFVPKEKEILIPNKHSSDDEEGLALEKLSSDVTKLEEENSVEEDIFVFCQENTSFFDRFVDFLVSRRKNSLAKHLDCLKGLLLGFIEKAYKECLWLFVFTCIVLGFRHFAPCVKASREASKQENFNRNTYQSNNRRLKMELLKFLEKNPELEKRMLKLMETKI